MRRVSNLLSLLIILFSFGSCGTKPPINDLQKMNLNGDVSGSCFFLSLSCRLKLRSHFIPCSDLVNVGTAVSMCPNVG